MVAASSGAQERLQAAAAELVPFDELIRRTPGAHRIGSIDDLRCDAFDTEEELEEFLAFVAESRRGIRQRRQQDAVPEAGACGVFCRSGGLRVANVTVRSVTVELGRNTTRLALAGLPCWISPRGAETGLGDQ